MVQNKFSCSGILAAMILFTLGFAGCASTKVDRDQEASTRVPADERTVVTADKFVFDTAAGIAPNEQVYSQNNAVMSAKPVTNTMDGVIQGGGGGEFTSAMFWDETLRSIIPGITDDNSRRHLRGNELARVLALMNPKVTSVEISEEPLYVFDQVSRKKIRVDAVNRRNARHILLFGPAWSEHFRQGMEIRQLILHEFLGLAGVDDSGYSISSRYFPPRTLPVSFDYKKMSCSLSTWMAVWKRPGYQIHNLGLLEYGGAFPRKEFEAPFSNPQLRGAKKGNKDSHRMVREARLRGTFDNSSWISDEQSVARLPRLFSAEMVASLEGESFSNGTGGARGKKFFVSPRISLMVEGLSRDKNGLEKTWGLTEETVYYYDTPHEADSIDFTIFHPDFLTALRRHGVQLKIGNAYTEDGTGQGVTKIHNLWNLMAEFAIKSGAKNDEEIDAIVRRTIFADNPDLAPLVIYGTCRFLK